MNKLDLFKMALGNLLRRKTRTLLTILGVVIGTSSIVVMMSLGIAMDKSFKEQLKMMGSLNNIEIYNQGYYGGGAPGGDEIKLDEKAVKNIEAIPGVQGVMPVKTAYMKIVAGKMVGSMPIIGIKPETMETFDFKVEEGRLLMDSDKDAIVFGKEIVWNFYNPRLNNNNRYFGPWGGGEPPQVELLSNKLEITGNMEYGERRRGTNPGDNPQKNLKVYKVKGVGILQASQSEKDYNAYMNMDALEKIIEETNRVQGGEGQRGRTQQNDQYERATVRVKDMNQVEEVQEKIKAMGFQTYSLTDMLKSMKETSAKMQAILGGIGAVSLFVAAIGITNTMVMSIYERTREIGVMKVLGADLKDIKSLFLLEAAMIGFGGGIFGLILSYSISFGLNKIGGGFLGGMGGTTGVSVIPVYLALGALGFSTMVGVISGFSPARRAMNLSALEAIRTE